MGDATRAPPSVETTRQSSCSSSLSNTMEDSVFYDRAGHSLTMIDDNDHAFELGHSDLNESIDQLHEMRQIDAFFAKTSSLMSNDTSRDASDHAESNSLVIPSTEATQLVTVTQSPHAPQKSNESSSTRRDACATVGYQTQREERKKQIGSHPMVEFVSKDGRVVKCKCGKSVRLNPAWYILKLEQHVVSRNCSFLRKKKTKKELAFQSSAASSSSTHPIESSNSQEIAAAPRLGQVVQPFDPPNASFMVASTSQVSESYGLRSASVLLQSCAASDEASPMFQALKKLVIHPNFSRITPDGKFLECKCSELLIMNTPWELREFDKHVASKNSNQNTEGLGPVRRKQPKKVSLPTCRVPRLGDGASFRYRRRQSRNGNRWDPVTAHTFLPCPGIRDDKVTAFIASSSQLTGGSRPRRKIAEELFPHLFPCSKSSTSPSASKQTDKSTKLSAAEKLILHDAQEAEALWFIDRDSLCIRSLDCKGEIHMERGEPMCSSCVSLHSNVSLRTSVTMAVQKRKGIESSSNNVRRPAARHFLLFEQEFSMDEEYARILRDLFSANVEERTPKNMWFDLAEMGITGLFDSNPTFIGLLESMTILKEKERRGVGLQNMNYSEQLDSFMRSIAKLSTEACEHFRDHLGGRKQKQLVTRKRKLVEQQEVSQGNLEPSDSSSIVSTGEDQPTNASQQASQASTLSMFTSSEDVLASSDMPILSIDDMHGNDNGSFHPLSSSSVNSLDEGTRQGCVGYHDRSDGDGNDALSNPSESNRKGNSVANKASALTSGVVPCTGLRDERVQAYVANAVQVIGGSRPKYVIAKELFPEVFSRTKKIKIVEKLSDHERLILQDAIFSECIWRVDKEGCCVRSLRCARRVDKKRLNGVCAACVDLKSVANFRSLLCRAKVPKNVNNLKFMPSVYAESDPFMHKLSKNASLRALYQVVKKSGHQDKKKTTFWLRFAKMGLFGHFRTHPVFEGLIDSMVEMKDRERRGVGKQNMQYARSLDNFMDEFATISVDAFEVFTNHFCGRTTRSQKVRKRRTVTTSIPIVEESSIGVLPVASTVDAASYHAHPLLSAEDLLAARAMSTSDMEEENQRFMDRMLDEVRLTMQHEMPLVPDLSALHDQEEPPKETDHVAPSAREPHAVVGEIDSQTYLDENGVLNTVL